jgi:hypothetical protein
MLRQADRIRVRRVINGKLAELRPHTPVLSAEGLDLAVHLDDANRETNDGHQQDGG